MVTYRMVGQRIRQARTELGLVQADLGRMLSRPRSHAAISDIERGKTKLDLEELAELAQLLQKPLAFFTELASSQEDHASVVYLRSQRGASPEQERLKDRSIEAFMQQARRRAQDEG